MTQALKRLKVLAALSKKEIEQTIRNMLEGLSTVGPVKPVSNLDFNIGETYARQSFVIVGRPRAVSTFFLGKGFTHISADTMNKKQGDSIATVKLRGAGVNTDITFTVYSGRS